MGKFVEMDHPLIQHKLTMIRNKNVGTKDFRALVDEIAMLKVMENRGLIKRQIYAEVPVKVEYSLTDIGWELEPLIHEMWVWGESYKANM